MCCEAIERCGDTRPKANNQELVRKRRLMNHSPEITGRVVFLAGPYTGWSATPPPLAPVVYWPSHQQEDVIRTSTMRKRIALVSNGVQNAPSPITIVVR